MKSYNSRDNGYVKSNNSDIYYHCYGSPGGQPIIVLNGGPGYSSDKNILKIFDLKQWNVILFDQRGTGESSPKGIFESNTTSNTIEDIDLLLKKFNLEKSSFLAESWGTTLALLFAIKYPEKVNDLYLASVFLGKKNESLIIRRNGFEICYPELYEYFVDILSVKEKKIPFKSYYNILFNDNDKRQHEAAFKAIFIENKIALPDTDHDIVYNYCNKINCLRTAQIEYKYAFNDFYLPANYIEKKINLINLIPCYIYHCKFDLITPFSSAWKLSKLMSNSNLIELNGCGHGFDCKLINSILIRKFS